MKSPYITPQGQQALVKELHELRYRTRPEVVKALSAAAAEGDRSENAEYIYRKKQLREIDRRIRYLMRREGELVVVNRLPEDKQKVFFGAYVQIEEIIEEQGADAASDEYKRAEPKQSCYRIVGSDETDLSEGWISVDSPVARALLSKSVGDEVQVKTPEGWRLLTILEVTYANQNSKQ